MNNLVGDVKANPRDFYRYINSQKKGYPRYSHFETSSPKGNDRSPDNKQVFLNSSQVSKRFFQLVKGS